MWTSPGIDISSFTNLNLAMDLSEVGDQEASDSIDVEYSLDGGASYTQLTSQSSDFTSYSIDSSLSDGSNIVLRVTGTNSADSEKHRFDNISLTGHAETILGENVGGKSSFSGAIDLGDPRFCRLRTAGDRPFQAYSQVVVKSPREEREWSP